MYIVSQDREQVINSDHVSVYYMEKIDKCYDYDPERQEPYCIMTDNGLKRNILGYYKDSQKANETLQILLEALQSFANVFYMPQP